MASPDIVWARRHGVGEVRVIANAKITGEQVAQIHRNVVEQLADPWITLNQRNEIEIRKPRGSSFGGAAERETIDRKTKAAREAVKDVLRNAGFKVK